MSIISWLLITSLACFLSFKVLMNKKREHTYEILINRVKRLRLNKMLQFLGADRDELIRVVPTSDINRLIERCSYCDTIDTCDSCLRDGNKVDSLSFCPNYKLLSELSKTIYHYRTH